MEKFGKSQPVRRFEDQRFVTGTGRYLDDIAPDDALHAVFLRSDVAHGVLPPLDLSEAREMPGVALALAAEDLEAMGIPFQLKGGLIEQRDGSQSIQAPRFVLAKDKVRFVGEPLAIIVGETMAAAKDAAEAIWAQIESLPAKMDLAVGGEVLHEAAPDNVGFDWVNGDEEAVAAAIAGAAHVVRTHVVDNRVIANSMEPRGCFAEWSGNRLHVAFSGQGVWRLRGELAKCFGLEPDDVRVSTPDVGGGFGMKVMDYPEYYAVAAAAKALGRPVRWASERTEAMLTDNGGRDIVSETTLAFDKDYRMVAYVAESVCNLGAYSSQFGHFIQTTLFANVASGVYDVENVFLRCKGIYTTTTQMDAYRGAGRPEAIFALERSMDNAARQLGVDPFELRTRNFIPPSKFPYKTALAATYDVGEFEMVMDRAKAEADASGFGTRRADAEARGRLKGIGLCYYIESVLGDPSETARIVFDEDGGVSLYVGTQSNGQGHETVFATFLSDQTAIPPEKIRFVQGDSDQIPLGGGTGGSRSVTVQSTAMLEAISTIQKQFVDYLAEKTGAEGIEFDDERFRIPGSNETPSMLDVAEMARADGRTEILDVSERITLETRSFPNGCHIAEVEVDPETGQVVVDRYTVTDDFGNLINPMLAEGQVHGGVVQGIGQAISEHVVFSDDGQLLTATFMDYGMPRASDVPDMHFTTECVPSTYNPLGMKGCGEAGTVGALAAVANAVADAVASAGGQEVQMPFTSERVWRALRKEVVA